MSKLLLRYFFCSVYLLLSFIPDGWLLHVLATLRPFIQFLFQSHQYGGTVIVKGCVQLNPVNSREDVFGDQTWDR